MHIKLNEDYNVAVDKALLGYLGETNSRPITFEGLEVEGADTYAMLIKYGEGAGSTYEVPITDNKMIVTAGVLYKAGDVRCQIVAKKFSGNEYKFVKKSDIFNLRVGNTLSDVGEIPTPEESQSLLDQILAQEKTIAKAISDANAAAEQAKAAAASIPEDYTEMATKVENNAENVSRLNEDTGNISNEMYEKEESESVVSDSNYELIANQVAYVDTNNEIKTYENANAYVMHKTVISAEKYTVLSQTHGSANTLLYAICDSSGKVIKSAKMGVSANTDITTDIQIPQNGVLLYLNYFPTVSSPLVVKKIETVKVSKIEGKDSVSCWGDSLTRGVGVGNTYSKAYPYVLYELLDGRKVYNCGVGGEDSVTIASRQGGLPNIVNPFTIPSDTSKTEIELTNIYGGSSGILLQGGSALDPITGQYVMTAKINPCVIKNVEGTLSYDNGKYYFSRSENGESVIVSRPSPLITHAMQSMRNNINIIWIGTNGGYTTSTELIENIRSMIEYMNPINKKYIVIGIHYLVGSVTETFDTIEKSMMLAFGRHYINERDYILKYGLSDAAITPTEEDTSAISQGKIPPSLLDDTVHYNAKGYNIIANLVYERGKELGYWTN